MKPSLLLIGFLLVFNSTLKSQNPIFKFDESGKLISFPFSMPYNRKSPPITIDANSFTKLYSKKVKDSLLSAAIRLESIYKSDDSLASKWILAVWDDTTLKKFRADINAWITFINNDSFPLNKSFIEVFPAVSEKRLESSNLLTIFPGSGKKGYPLNAPTLTFTGQDDTLWSVDGTNGAELHFKILFNDSLRAELLNNYNTLYPSVLKNWNCEKLKFLLDTIKNQHAHITDLINLIDSSKNFFCTSLSDTAKYRELVSKASLLLSKPHLEDSIFVILTKNKKFFLSWLWLTGGKPRFNPFNFTSPKNFCIGYTTADSLVKDSREKFDNKIEQALRQCPVCNLNKDSLIAWLKQRQNGISYFKPPDSLKLVTENKKAFEDFTHAKIKLYSMEYPYTNEGDSSGYVYQFDAAHRFRRVDLIPLRRWFQDPSTKYIFTTSQERLKRITSNLPDDQKVYLAIHNIPLGVRIKITENQSVIKDASKLENGIDSITSSLAAFAGDIAGINFPSLAPLNNFIVPPSPTYYAAINPSNITSSLTSQVNKGNPKYPLLGKTLTQTDVQIEVNNKIFKFTVLDGQILFCNLLFSDILSNDIDTNFFVCYNDIIDKFLKNKISYCAYSNRRDFEKKVDDLRTKFKALMGPLQDLIKNINETKAKLVFYQNRIQTLMNMQGWSLPPTELKVNEESSTDTALYRTQVLYPQTASLKKDSYVLSYKRGNDTIPKKAASGEINMAPRHLFDLGIGLAGTVNNIPVNTVTQANGQLAVSQDNQPFRFIVGIHIYPGRLFNLDDRFVVHQGMGSTSWSRLSLFLGTGFPDPLQNWYSGLSADLVPGLRLQMGIHWVWYTKYQLLNNQIQDQASALIYGGWYIGLTISPVDGVKKLLGAFK